MQSFNGKSVLVTGGGVGIGKSIVEAFANAGARVSFTYLTHEPNADELRKALKSPETELPRGLRVDATSEEEVIAAVQNIADEQDGIDILVNNIGGLLSRLNTVEMETEFWLRTMDVNLTSMFMFTRESLKFMNSGWGRIINVSSLAAHNGGSNGSTAYATSKAGMLGFTRGLAKEVGRNGITVNAVAPGLILDTPFHETFTPVDAQQQAIGGIAVGRAGVPADVAGPVLWLASDQSAFISGSVVDINGAQYFA